MMAVFDPYKAYRAGLISGALIAAADALELAFVQAFALDPDSDPNEGLIAHVDRAQQAVREARALDLWQLSRP